MQTKTLDILFKAKALENEGEFEGYGSMFGNVDYGGDVVVRGAFADTLAQSEKDGRVIPMLWAHERNTLIGKWLNIKEDAQGLKVRGSLNLKTQKGLETYELLKQGAIGGMSIGYGIPDGGIEPHATKKGVFNLTKLDLFEVSLVPSPMNVRAKLSSIKSILANGTLPSLSEFETFLREAGFSKTQAVAVANKGLSALLRSESADEPKSDDAKAFLSKILK